MEGRGKSGWPQRLWLFTSGLWFVLVVEAGMIPALSRPPPIGWGIYVLVLLGVAAAPPLALLCVWRFLAWAIGTVRKGDG